MRISRHEYAVLTRSMLHLHFECGSLDVNVRGADPISPRRFSSARRPA